MAWYYIRGISGKQGLWGGAFPPEITPHRPQVIAREAELVGGFCKLSAQIQALHVVPEPDSKHHCLNQGRWERTGNSFCSHFVRLQPWKRVSEPGSTVQKWMNCGFYSLKARRWAASSVLRTQGRRGLAGGWPTSFSIREAFLRLIFQLKIEGGSPCPVCRK